MLTGMATYSGVCSEGVKILLAHFTPEICDYYIGVGTNSVSFNSKGFS